MSMKRRVRASRFICRSLAPPPRHPFAAFEPWHDATYGPQNLDIAGVHATEDPTEHTANGDTDVPGGVLRRLEWGASTQAPLLSGFVTFPSTTAPRDRALKELAKVAIHTKNHTSSSHAAVSARDSWPTGYFLASEGRLACITSSRGIALVAQGLHETNACTSTPQCPATTMDPKAPLASHARQRATSPLEGAAFSQEQCMTWHLGIPRSPSLTHGDSTRSTFLRACGV